MRKALYFLGPSTPSMYRGNTALSLKSAMTIFPRALLSDRLYRLLVSVTSRTNASLTSTGHLLVRVENQSRPVLFLGYVRAKRSCLSRSLLLFSSCSIASLCQLQSEYQLINPTTQIALFSLCGDSCLPILNVTWSIYAGHRNVTLNQTQWNFFQPIHLYDDVWFFGRLQLHAREKSSSMTLI
jgi:hypothetical protein